MKDTNDHQELSDSLPHHVALLMMLLRQIFRHVDENDRELVATALYLLREHQQQLLRCQGLRPHWRRPPAKPREKSSLD